MVSFAFETAGPDDGDECSPAPDLMDMINGGSHTVSAVETIPFIAAGTLPVFGDFDEETSGEAATDEAEEEDTEVDSEEEKPEEQEDNDSEDTEFVRSQFTNCALMRQRIEDELKEIKQEEKALLKKLQRLMNRDLEEETKQPDKQTDSITDDSQPMLPFEETSAVSVTDKWEKISAETVLSYIPKLSAKKKEALMDVFQNLKQMEDLRGDASRQFKHFSELLPEGIGKVLADQLEEAMYAAMK
jgi:hypothetical protein